MGRGRLLLALSALGIAVTAATALAAGAEDGPGPREFGGPGFDGPRVFGGPGVYGGRGYFVVSCGFSHMNRDDPIVFPRRRGQSHHHTFFGNRSTNAFSTAASLRGRSTSCRLRDDTAAYWVPSLMVGEQPVEPLGATILYVRRTTEDPQAFPRGLKMIAGNAAASSPQSHRLVFWSCGFPLGGGASSAVPTCSEGRRARLQLNVNYPNCWNGRSLDSADHKGHMAYSVDGRCPGSHPVELPAITLIVHYAVSGARASLASGSTYSAHGDFVNAWDQDTLERLVDRYLTDRRRPG